MGVPVPVPFLGDALVVVAAAEVVIVVCTDIVVLEVAVVVCIVCVVLEVAVVVGIVRVEEQGRGCPKNVILWKNGHKYPQTHPKRKSSGCFGKFRIFASRWALRF